MYRKNVIIAAITFGLIAVAIAIGTRQQEAPQHAPMFQDLDGERWLAQHSPPRSSAWIKVEHEHLVKEPGCRACPIGHKGVDVQVHHIVPFHIDPSKELDPKNVITLCRRHHFMFGHCEDYKSWNPHVVEDCDRWRERLTKRPYK